MGVFVINRWPALALFAILLAAGCSYPEVSPAAYEYAKALYGVADRQAVDRLSEVRGQIEAKQTEGQISAPEAAWLLEIVSLAEQGDWQAAKSVAREIMHDQVK